MFQIKNGRLYADTEPCLLSFAIPDGFWIDTDPPIVSDYGILLLTADRSVRINLDLLCGESDDIRTDLIKDAVYDYGELPSMPEPIIINNLKGYSLYVFKGCEIQVDISAFQLYGTDGILFDRLAVVISADDCSAVMNRTDVKEFLFGIKAG